MTTRTPNSGTGGRGRGRGGSLGRGQRGSRGTRGFRGRGQGRGRSRGQVRGRGSRVSNRSAKPSRYQEYECKELSVLAEQMNKGNAFYLVNKKSIYTDEDIRKYRGDRLKSMVRVNQTNQRTESTIRPPTDLGMKLKELVQRGITEEALSNCWPLSGSFFDDLVFHGWTITFNPMIPMSERTERKIQLFGGIGNGSWQTKRNKLKYLEEIFGHIAFDNQTIWTTENRVHDWEINGSQFTLNKDQFCTNHDITFVYQGTHSIEKTPLQEAERLLHLSFLRPVLDLAGFVKDGPQERK